MGVKGHWAGEEVDVMRVLSAAIKKDPNGWQYTRKGFTEDTTLV